MPEAQPPVFWVCGAPGAGKSVAAWALFEALVADGLRVGYVDIDQLGMAYPARDDDPERHLLKQEALIALLPGYAAEGAQVLIVSGVLDASSGPAVLSAAGADLALCLLLPDSAALRERLFGRDWSEELVEKAMAEHTLLRNATFVDAVVDTAELSVGQTVERLQELVRVAPGSPQTASPPVARPPCQVAVVVVTGPRIVGSSTVGFGLARTRWRAGLRTGFVDLQQLAFLAGPRSPTHVDPALGITHLAVMHALLAARGPGLLVVCGHLTVADRPALRAALQPSAVTIVRLRSDVITLEAHVQDRVNGRGARLAGDDLLGVDPGYQAAVVAAALAEQEYLDAHANDDVVIDVTGRSPADVVADIEHRFATQIP
jgi:broad-specificity NMP kinase